MKKAKVALAIILPLLLAAGGGWYYFAQPTKLEVREGKTVMLWHYPQPGGSNTLLNYTTAVTEIENAGRLKFSISKMGYMTFKKTKITEIDIHFTVEGKISKRFKLGPLVIQSNNIAYENNTTIAMDFYASYLRGNGVTLYPSKDMKLGAWTGDAAFVKFRVIKNNFSLQGLLHLLIPGDSYNHMFVIELKGTLYVENTPASAIIRIHIVSGNSLECI